jgi:uncharacterized membrane protein YccC
VQTSPWSTLALSAQRILGAGLGVLVASAWVNVVGLSWWSFASIVAVAVLIARKLPFSIGGQLQIPVAVIFVMALGPESIEQDVWRVLDVLIGGVIGIATVFLWPGRPPVAQLMQALQMYRDDVYVVLRAMASEVGTHPQPLSEMHAFVARARELRNRSDACRDALLSLAESSRLNLRGRSVQARIPLFAMSYRRLTGLAIQIRALAGGANQLYDTGHPVALQPDQFRELVDRLLAQMHEALGAAGTPVLLTGEAGPLDDSGFGSALRESASALAAEHGDVGTVLESVSTLGRLDYLREQVNSYATNSDSEEVR